MDYTVSAVDEAIRLLTLVAEHPGLGVSEIARRSGNTKGRTFRLLSTLEQQHLVQRQGANATYHLDYKILHLAACANDQINLARLIQKPIEDLGRIFNETITVRIREGLETVCIAKWEATLSLRVHKASPHALHTGAASKLLLAHAPQSVVDAVFELHELTPTDRQTLSDELTRIQLQGHARSVSERVANAASIAVPIKDKVGSVIASLSISTPPHRLTDDRAGLYLRELQIHADHISQNLSAFERLPARPRL